MSRKLGLSLIEISITLAIIGLMLGGMLDVMKNSVQRNKIDITNYILDRAVIAFYAYAFQNKRIPCPDTGYDGAEGGSINTLGNCSQNYGRIPYAALSLPPYFSYDGWRRSITYIISPNSSYTYSDKFYYDSYGENFDGGTADSDYLKIYDKASSGNLIKNAVYIFISHGQSGYGSIYNNSSAFQAIFKPPNIVSLDKLENANYNIDKKFVYRSISDRKTDYYDDIMRYGNGLDIITGARFMLGKKLEQILTYQAYSTESICDLFLHKKTDNTTQIETKIKLRICNNLEACENKLTANGSESIANTIYNLCIYNIDDN